MLECVLRLALSIACALSLLVAGEAKAGEAESVSYEGCHVEAYLTPDGNLNVVERWTVTFVGAWSGIEWTVDTARTGAKTVTILGAGEVGDGGLVAYEPSAAGTYEPDTYRVTGGLRRRTCTLHLDRSNETAELYVAFLLRGAAKRWRDASVLSWPFLETSVGCDVGDVTLDLFVERPEDGGVWPQENVFCWCSVGERAFVVDDISDECVDAWPHVHVPAGAHAAHIRARCGSLKGGETASAAVLFPQGWLTGVVRGTDSCRGDLMERMDALVESADGRARDQRTARYVFLLAAVALPLLALARFRRWKRART